MADIHLPNEAETRARWGAFAWTAENAEKAKAVIARYPAGRQRSAVMPLLDLAQRQVGAETQTQVDMAAGHAHAVASSMASAVTEASSCSCASSTQYGGIQYRMSPSGRSSTPRASAAR